MVKSQVWMQVLHFTLKNKVFADLMRPSNRQATGENSVALMGHINEKKVNDMAPLGAVFPSAQL
jgi:hypothetical protein